MYCIVLSQPIHLLHTLLIFVAQNRLLDWVFPRSSWVLPRINDSTYKGNKTLRQLWGPILAADEHSIVEDLLQMNKVL